MYGWLRNDQIPSGNGSTTLVNSAEVCANIDNVDISATRKIGCTYSSEFGTFNITGSYVYPNNPVLNLRVGISSDGKHTIVQDRNSDSYVDEDIKVLTNIHGSTLFANVEVDSNDGDLQNALWIVDSISDARQYFTDTYEIETPKVTVNWEKKQTPRDFLISTTGG